MKKDMDALRNSQPISGYKDLNEMGWEVISVDAETCEMYSNCAMCQKSFTNVFEVKMSTWSLKNTFCCSLQVLYFLTFPNDRLFLNRTCFTDFCWFLWQKMWKYKGNLSSLWQMKAKPKMSYFNFLLYKSRKFKG